MDQSFDPDTFIRQVGIDLVQQVSKTKASTTPATVGSATETSVRKQLQQLLPRGIAVGQGFVIDSYGKTSKQQDIILFERDICPVFQINDDLQTSFYPCEGVIAVCEIKSYIDSTTLRDAFSKIESVKSLTRYYVTQFMPNPTTGKDMPSIRDYLMWKNNSSILDVNETIDERFDVRGFVLGGESKLSQGSLIKQFADLPARRQSRLVPDLLVCLDGHVVSAGNVAKQKRQEKYKLENGTYGVRVYQDGSKSWQPSWAMEDASSVAVSKEDDPFRTLVSWIRQATYQGKPAVHKLLTAIS